MLIDAGNDKIHDQVQFKIETLRPNNLYSQESSPNFIQGWIPFTVKNILSIVSTFVSFQKWGKHLSEY